MMKLSEIDLSENKQHYISQRKEPPWLNKYSSKIRPIFSCCRLLALATIKLVATWMRQIGDTKFEFLTSPSKSSQTQTN